MAKGARKMTDVFISYHNDDEAVAQQLCEKLERTGISVWYAGRDVMPGHLISRAIMNAMQQCGICVFIFSKSSVYSARISSELEYAVKLIRDERRRTSIFPLVIDAEGKSVLPERTTQGPRWFDASEPPLETRLEEFAQVLARTLHEPKESAS